MSRFITIGRIVGSHGVDGALKILPLTFSDERLYEIKRVYLVQEGKHIPFYISDSRRYRGGFIIHLKGISNREEAESLRGLELQIPEEESPPAGENEFYHYQIIGLDVFTEEDVYLGKVTGILETGSNDVFIVEPSTPYREKGKKEFLIPAIEDVVSRIDLTRGKMIINPMEGLLDL
ncbi:MAG: 16S rRNA processing protein RimM [Nitrospirae bacterium]|nr:MAG: 16S rRNA processing protein RimM [Nitrospirota bacterium]